MWFSQSCYSISCWLIENSTKSVCWQLWSWWRLPSNYDFTNVKTLGWTWRTWNKLYWILTSLPWNKDKRNNYVSRWTYVEYLTSTEISPDYVYMYTHSFSSAWWIYVNSPRKVAWFPIVCIKD